MDRCAVLVDAGYLLGGAATLLSGDADRSALEIDHAALVSALIDEAEVRTGLPVLRVLWYDAAPEARPQPEHRTLRTLPDVKVRLGDLVRRGSRYQQKGVDSFLQRDLTTLARNRAVADVVLLGGDEDLRRGVEEAQDFGIRVHLWGVEAAAPEFNQSETLIGEADRRWVIPAGWIRERIALRAEAVAVLPDLTHGPASAVGHEGLPTAEGDAGTGPHSDLVAPQVTLSELADAMPTRTSASPSVDLGHGGAGTNRDATSPATLARRLDAQAARRQGRSRPIAPPPLPCLRDVTSQAQAWADNEEDVAAVIEDPSAIGGRFGVRWRTRVAADQLAALRREDPILPRPLDGELLRFADRMGLDTWEDEDAKLAVRGGFWRAIRILIAEEDHVAGEDHRDGEDCGDGQPAAPGDAQSREPADDADDAMSEAAPVNGSPSPSAAIDAPSADVPGEPADAGSASEPNGPTGPPGAEAGTPETAR